MNLTVQDRIDFFRKGGASYFESLTPTELAKLFPKYYLQQLPDIGISASGIIPGRQLPSAGTMPGVGQPTTAATRAARRAQPSGDQPGTDKPGTGTAPGTSPDTALWQPGGTPEVNRSGNLPKRNIGGIDRSKFNDQMSDPAVRSAVLARMRIEVGSQGPKAQQMWLETVFNRAASRNLTLMKAVDNHDGYYPRKDDHRWKSTRNNPPISNHEKLLDAVHIGGSDLSKGATGNASDTTGFDQGRGKIIRTQEEADKTGVPIGKFWAPGQTAEAGGERFGIEGRDKRFVLPRRAEGEEEYLPPLALVNPKMLNFESKVIAGRQLPTGTRSVSSIIANAESGNKGYNAYNKGTTRSGGLPDIDFSTLTVRELMEMQSKREVFAVGKYQIIPSTMKAAISVLKISPDEKFTPELQERIFSQYLTREKRPAIEKYIKGSGNLDDARRSIAQEWAGIAYNGKSWYAGDSAGNAAHPRTEGEMRAALERARAVYAELIKQGVDPDTAYARALSTGAQQQQAPAARVYIGDSVAEGLGRGNDNATSYTKVGASPTAILADVKKIAQEALDGKDVVLSAGLLNDPKQASVVRDIIREIKAKGGNVLLVGGPTEGAREDLAGVNDVLADIAKEEGVRFLGGFKSSDGVHPLNYASVDSKISPVKESAIPQTATIVNEQGYSAPVTGTLMYGGHGRTSGFMDQRRHRHHHGTDVYSVDPKTGKLRVGSEAPVIAPMDGTYLGTSTGRVGYRGPELPSKLQIARFRDSKGKIHEFLHVGDTPAINPNTGKPWQIGDKIKQGETITYITGSGTKFGDYVIKNFRGDAAAAVRYLDDNNLWDKLDITRPHLHAQLRVNGKLVNYANIIPGYEQRTERSMTFSTEKDRLDYMLSKGQITQQEYNKQIEKINQAPAVPATPSAVPEAAVPAAPEAAVPEPEAAVPAAPAVPATPQTTPVSPAPTDFTRGPASANTPYEPGAHLATAQPQAQPQTQPRAPATPPATPPRQGDKIPEKEFGGPISNVTGEPLQIVDTGKGAHGKVVATMNYDEQLVQNSNRMPEVINQRTNPAELEPKNQYTQSDMQQIPDMPEREPYRPQFAQPAVIPSSDNFSYRLESPLKPENPGIGRAYALSTSFSEPMGDNTMAIRTPHSTLS